MIASTESPWNGYVETPMLIVAEIVCESYEIRFFSTAFLSLSATIRAPL
jgi:hypothetical protein